MAANSSCLQDMYFEYELFVSLSFVSCRHVAASLHCTLTATTCEWTCLVFWLGFVHRVYHPTNVMYIASATLAFVL